MAYPSAKPLLKISGPKNSMAVDSGSSTWIRVSFSSTLSVWLRNWGN